MAEVSCAEGVWVEPASRRRLAYRWWRPANPRELLVIVHGFAEHGGRYAAVAEALAARGVCVGAPDLWGHGRSGGARGVLGELADCVRDLEGMTNAVFLPRAGLARYAVFGHSFGALAAIVWALRSPQAFHRFVAQSPLIDVAFPLPYWKTALARSLAGWWPSCRFHLGLDAQALSRDPAVVQAYRRDPLVHHAMSAGTYRSLKRWQREVERRPAEVRASVLLLCGAEDRIVSIEAARRWFGGVTAEKRCEVFPGCFHELHHEPVRDEVVRLIADWVFAEGDGVGDG
ncbi:MAG: hypothetical protein A3B78_03410 [Omnitrophica WOR_2 bacterium RIFCSPHIGHO2_02_FULL_67_20]|nr:MAG: hypothetical protein A3B78_03410 [Omnitrophica WOR_2 bacterium RIFCSPHIGHO2_02_FULL_67_20]